MYFLGINFEFNKEYKGVILEIKKCIFGYGTKFIVISFKSIFSYPSNLIELIFFVKIQL